MKSSETFFIVTPIYFENLALYELDRTLKSLGHEIPDYEIFPGGIELNLPLSVGLSLNLYLKIPVRILLRLGTKEMTEMEEFGSDIQFFDWSVYRELGKIVVTTKSSRLRYKDEIAKTFKRKVKANFSETGTDVYIRFFRDECTLSVDTSGEALFKRGQGKKVGEAPIRDNFASGLVQLATQGIRNFSNWEIIDPMAGSGTLLFEAATIGQASDRPFQFQSWDMDIPLLVGEQNEKLFSSYGAADKEKKMVVMMEGNNRRLGIENFSVRQQDLMRAPEANLAGTGKKRLVISNPPYGVRLSITEKDIFTQIFRRIDQVYSPERIGLITPRGVKIFQEKYELSRHFNFENNGIPVTFHLFLRRDS